MKLKQESHSMFLEKFLFKNTWGYGSKSAVAFIIQNTGITQMSIDKD